MWDIVGDRFSPLDDNGILAVAQLLLDELELEVLFFNDDE